MTAGLSARCTMLPSLRPVKKAASTSSKSLRSIVRAVYDVAVTTRSARAVAEHLVKMERGHMGLSGWRRWKARLPVAQKILELVADMGPLP